MSWNLTEIEKRAIEAQSLPSFPINVDEIRRTVAALLSQFGRNGIFDEYTVHSFDHVYEMLKTLEWLVPLDTCPLLTKADWLLITLSCYFHDLGLLVTKDEFDARDQTSFRDFSETILFTGPDGSDYRAKINELNPEEREKFLYQEFVRYHHAARVRDWIIGRPNVALGQAQAAADQIDKLLTRLDRTVRLDLANICESHNLDDLDSREKYPLYRPYGSSAEEATNVQYIALLLRTTDLIQITKQRAPTVLYKTINPKDPISQIEWLKQNAVKQVRPQPKSDRSGEVSANIQSDTIDVYADFNSPDGYFGLTSYLQYAGKELQRSYELAEKSKKSIERKLSFPWRFIDDGHIKAEGFIPQKFGFELDQERILDLLTGHTLYNDSAVVLRELAQNSIDAVRLQASQDKESSDQVGKVEIRWDSKKLELEIADNGTGMTQEIIEKHLLKVGSSRYQDPKFREEHPDFSPISRFGIGVLSAFMIADVVEITTCSSGDEPAREISLRSVHGRYLIRLLDKKFDSEAKALLPHGTKFKLKLRASAAKIDILSAVRRWIVIPRCTVTVTIDNSEPTKVGFASPKDALQHYLSESLAELVGKQKHRVEERIDNGLTLAYGLKLDPLFGDWSFIPVPDRRYTSHLELLDQMPGICIEGIAVQFNSPGFRDRGIIAIANATGVSAPKTDVARSALENTPERREVIRKIYDIAVRQIDEETARLATQEDYSISRAINQIEYLAAPFSRPQNLLDNSLRAQSFARLGVFLFEDDNNRKVASLEDLKAFGKFWTIHSPLITSVEHLIRETPGNITARSVFKLMSGRSTHLPAGPFVANIEARSMALDMVSEYFEVRDISGSASDRKLLLHWAPRGNDAKWRSIREIIFRMRRLNQHASARIERFFEEIIPHRGRRTLQIPATTFSFAGLETYAAVVAVENIYFQSNVPVIDYIKTILPDSSFEASSRAYIYLNLIESFLFSPNFDEGEIRARLDQMFRDLAARGLDAYVLDWESFSESAQKSTFRVFDPTAWSRRSSDNDEIHF
jgi:molecular chaperone HtpG